MSELHRISTGGGTPQADVIFVHGLDGHPFKTWQHDPDRQTDCWLHWLADDAPHLAVHTLQYAAASTEWFGGRAMSLVDRADEVLAELAHQGIGERPIVFLCHSLGGLVVKQLLRTASDADDARWRTIAEQTSAVVFLATPHAGARLANALQRVGLVAGVSPAIKDLRAQASALRDLNKWYRGFAERSRIRTLCFYETYKTRLKWFGFLPYGAIVVQPGDADPGIGGVRPQPVDADHTSVCKPGRRDDKRCASVLDLVREIAPQAPPDDKPVPVDPLRMRADLDDFQPRGDSQRKVIEALHRGPAATVAICGMGGGGKSVLAVHVAHDLDRAGETPDGQRLLDLHGVSETPLLSLEAMARIVQSFDETAARPASQDEAAIAYRKMLDGKRVLLVLDNARDDAQVAPLLKHRAPTTRVIVTSRRTITAESIDAIALDEMPPDQAQSFLLGIIGEGRATGPEIERLVRRCGRLPLALRVAGRFLKGHPGLAIGDYIEAVDQAAVDFAVPGEPDTDVRAVLGLSAKALAREEPALAARWQVLAVFPDEFDRDGAAAVWEVEATTASLQLSELAARSMVIHDEASRRWRLHDLMRDVAQVPLEGQDQATLQARLEAARARHARHYCGVLETAGNLYLKGGEGVLAGLALYDLEQRNIATGQSWCARKTKTDETAVALAAAFGKTLGAAYVLEIRLHPRERIDWLEAQRKACVRLGDRRGEVYALGNLGVAWGNLGEARRAIEFHEQSLAIAHEIGDRQGESNALGNLGNAWAGLGEPRRAIESYEQVLTISREIGDRRGEGNALNNLGVAWAALGEPRRATEFYEQRLVIAREIGDRRGEGSALFNAGLALDALGKRDDAVRRVREALAIVEAIGAEHHAATVRAQLAEWGAEDGRS